MKILRRLISTSKYKIYTTIILLITSTYLLLKWNIFCSNIQAWQQVKKMCENQPIGSLCGVCSKSGSYICHTSGSTKNSVFSVISHNTRVVFKSVDDVKTLHWYDNGKLRYPTQSEFASSIKALVRNKLNVTVQQDVIQRLSNLFGNSTEKHMDMMWSFIQNNEFLLAFLYPNKDFFPHVLGTCGTFYAVEYLEPLQSAPFETSLENWSTKLREALQILALLDELESAFSERFYLCDVKMEHFGMSENRVKLVDLNAVFPHAVLSNACEKDEDCYFIDCKGRCVKNKCKNYENLRVVCEKIFLGWKMQGTVLMNGLLMTQFTPGGLAAMLRQCSQEGKLDEDFRERLYGILIEIEQKVNNDLMKNHF